MALEKFHYTTDGGEKITVPKFKTVPAGVIRRVRKESQAEQIFTVLEALADEATLALVDDLDADEFNRFVQAWQEDSKVTMGESSASTSS